MKTHCLVSIVIALAAPAGRAQQTVATPQQLTGKIGIVHIQNAILNTKDGQQAAKELQARMNPRQAELQELGQTIEALKDRARKSGSTMNDEARAKLEADVVSKSKAYARGTEDFNAELEQEQGKILQRIGGKMMAVVEKYATENGLVIVLDISNPQTPVLWASAAADIGKDVVKLYDEANRAPATAPKSTPAPVRNE